MLPCVFIWLFVIFNSQTIEVHGLKQFAEIEITRGEPLNATDDFADLSGVKIKKVNRKHVISGVLDYKKGISNDQQCTVLLYKKQGGEYRLTSFKVPEKGCCDYYNEDTFVIPDFEKQCEKCPKQKDKVCPWPADKYTVQNMDVDIKKIPPNFYGDFKFEFRLSQNNQLLAGYSFYGTIIR